MKRFWIVFGILVVMIGGGFGVCWRVMSSFEDEVSVAGGVLVWRVAGDFAEERDDSFIGQVRDDGSVTFSEALFALLRAAEDDRISALVMDIGAVDCDWAKLDELREAVTAFRENDKPVLAYLDGGGLREYALASVADRVVMAPEGTLMIMGLSAELAFMKDTLTKLGMEADFIHVGAYKSAPERMTRSSASDANREMITSIVDDRYEMVLTYLAGDRDVPRERVTAWIDQGMHDAEGALAAGLVDTLRYYDDMLDDVFPEDEITYLDDYRLESRSHGAGPRVAMIYVTGVIMPGESRFDPWQGKLAGDETVCEQLRQAAEDDDIEAVILRVDSPGGSALASDLIWAEIRALRRVKPVIVSMSGMAASGGYYVSCLADSVFADAGTLTGSIGVYAGKLNRHEMYRKIGVNREYITRGENALMLTDEGGFSSSQRNLFQGQMDAFYERFLQKVAEGRDLSRDQVHEVAQGRVWTGRQGVERGLVDGLGGLRRSLDAAKHMLGLDAASKVTVVIYGKQLSLIERMLLRSLRDGGLSRLGAWLDAGPTTGVPGTVSLVSELVTTLREDGTLAAVELLDGGPVAMTPYTVRLR